MVDQPNQVFFPVSFPELFTVWTRFPDAVPFAGGTEIIRNQGTAHLVLPQTILSLDKIEELGRITRTERYLEIGAMVKLNDIAGMGKIVPEALTRCIEGIAGPGLRNLATIGGNLCVKSRRLDISAPLAALDAVYELRNAQTLRWISASRFSSLPGLPAIGSQELLTRIRIPLEQWSYTAYRKFGSRNAGKQGGVMVFILKNQKTTLTDLRLVFAGEGILRDKNAEALLIGKHLPLSRRDAADFAEQWRVYLSALDKSGPLIHSEILNFIRSFMSNLSD
ncbi:MAG: FAD binding domain-containing protein [Treponema sp.]|jgi:CO/xanthine dehydrogenase FAD-binding subunit|nr:FAD binding domain-containing protein [Treponema sp.]